MLAKHVSRGELGIAGYRYDIDSDVCNGELYELLLVLLLLVLLRRLHCSS